ncbi:TPA: hypothetical protein NIY10_000669, partial [Klebsiella pneumoniae]|nr:hypothetical protein [Klebsiella pneumoniae]HCF8814390.1 hypothetical protein [Klebsiella pneumoniae]
MKTTNTTRRQCANALRALSMDAVQKAKSGHPGAPMGMADIAEVLWRDFLNHNPNNPAWADRDRFVLSNGHGSMLIYSLAGTLKLGKLVAFYDDNGISIDGHVEGWFTDDTAKRFEAYGWHVVRGVDGHDADAIKRAVEEARAVTDKPSLLMCKTIIGFGSPNKAGTHDSHGAPLGDAEIALTREALDWKHAPFDIPSDIYAQWDAKEAGQAKEAAWNEKFAA